MGILGRRGLAVFAIYGVTMSAVIIITAVRGAIDDWRTRRAARYLDIDHVPRVADIRQMHRDIRAAARVHRRRARQDDASPGTRRWELRDRDTRDR